MIRLRSLSYLSCCLLLASCGNAGNPSMQGYVEADYVDVGAQVAGRLLVVHVEKGRRVAAGDDLFELDANPENLAAQQTHARLAGIQAQQHETEAGLKLAEAQLLRAREMRSKSFISDEQVDQAVAARDQLRAHLESLRESGKSALAAHDSAEWALQQKHQAAPVDAVVEDVFYQLGEVVPAGKAVVRLLPEDGLKLRFFVPQSELGAWHVGDKITANCDGCAAAVHASVSFVATTTEFTPPVIFSRESREKLVVMLEARLASADVARLHVGQPVDVFRAGP